MDFQASNNQDQEFDFNDPYSAEPEQIQGSNAAQSENSSKLKRTACVLCRKRKLRCDTARPKCGTCDRLGHDCEYNEIRKKSGPKRGYVKALEARLSQVETQLKTGPNETNAQAGNGPNPQTNGFQANLPGRHPSGSPHTFAMDTETPPSAPAEAQPPSMEPSWDMVALGLEEPLPTIEVQTELFELYFRKIHPTAPMLHKARFYKSLNYAPHMRPPVSLRYAMWTLAAGASDAYSDMQQHFYRRARKYMEIDEMRGYGEATLSLACCQTSVLFSIYEFKNMHFPRAWLSTGRAVRLSQMLGLQRLDGTGLEVKTCCAPPADWTEKEERKRTFWMAFWEDRCASIGTGWPMSIDEQDIMTHLPASEDAFQSSTPELAPSLDAALKGQLNNISPFASAIMLTALFGRNLLHLHRPSAEEREHDLNGAFWKRHRSIDSTLLNITLNLPDHLRIPRGLPDPNVMFMNMCIHTSIICLHQAAIFKVDRNKLPANIGQESKIRCVTAAAEIANIMRSISHCDLGTLNPFSAFCLYVAARVFVQYLKSRRNDTQILGSLHFLLSAMHALKRKTPLAESFLAQLDVDLEGAGIPTNHESSLEALRKKGFSPQMLKDMNLPKGSSAFVNHDNNSFVNNDSSTSNTTGNSPATDELRVSGQRFSPFANNENAAFKSLQEQRQARASINGPGRITDYNWANNEQGATVNTNRQPSMDGSNSTIGMQSRSGSTSQNVFTPPQSESSGELSNQTSYSNNNQSQGNGDFSKWTSQDTSYVSRTDTSDAMNLSSLDFDDNQPAGFVQFKDYPPAADNQSSANGGQPADPGNSANFSLTGQTPMTQQQFDELTKNFMPPTPGGDLDAWTNGASFSYEGTGLTPKVGGTPLPSSMGGTDWLDTDMINFSNFESFEGQTMDDQSWNRNYGGS